MKTIFDLPVDLVEDEIFSRVLISSLRSVRSTWKVLDDVTPDWEIWDHHLHNVSLKGNAYFSAHKIITEEGRSTVAGFFVCFDFTTERFGPLLPLPCQYHRGRVSVSYSCVREEQLAVLYQHCDARETTEISVTDKIGPDVVSWTKFLKVVSSICVHPSSSSFFIDVEKKIVVVFLLEMVHDYLYQTAHVFGQDGYFKSVRIRQALLEDVFSSPTLVCSSYLPSLLQPTMLIERM
ncbi:F-box/kelch-repeat protein At3g13680-like [Brassica rapa]|uniref:F-box/kelch-repeat protein At3g13680-like n=1 Tax=Brassica campestris TaxID=3711 RepID=UPI00142DD4A7|nr:F-box/kelch-repeat protein At3g13680-like [Brassica rapa]